MSRQRQLSRRVFESSCDVSNCKGCRYDHHGTRSLLPRLHRTATGCQSLPSDRITPLRCAKQVARSSKLVMAEVEGSLSPDLHRSALERGRKADKAEKAERKEKRRQRKAGREAAPAADAVSELKDDQRARKDPDKVACASPHPCLVAQRLCARMRRAWWQLPNHVAMMTAKYCLSSWDVRMQHVDLIAMGAGPGEKST